MNEYSKPNRTQQLWSHLAGLFGAEALKRKFGVTAPAEWASVLGELSHWQLAHGLQTLLKSGRENIPSLPEFLGMCRQAREWASPIPQIEDARFDKWDRAANFHLMGYLKARNTPKRYSPDSAMRPGPQGNWEAFGGPQTIQRTGALLRAKQRWAQCMREEAADENSNEVAVDTQRAIWDLEMARAEREIDGLSQQAAA